jgi:hypothetical protein
MTLERIETALFNRLLLATGTVLEEYYRDAFIFWIQFAARISEETSCRQPE